MKRIACLFSGQGIIDKTIVNSEWYSTKISKSIFDSAEELLDWNIDDYLRNLSYEELAVTNIAQPLIFTINMAMYYNIFANSTLKSSVFLGHSLGEYCALVAAGSLSFHDGLKIVKKRGELMAGYYSTTDTAMASILGANLTVVENMVRDNCDDQGVVDIAAYNSDKQVVISGHKNKIDKIVEQFNSENVNAIILAVGGPFHSRLYAEEQCKFASFLQGFNVTDPIGFFISSVTGERLKKASEIVAALSKQITKPVLWTKAISTISDTFQWIGVEIGSKSVLKGFSMEQSIICSSDHSKAEEVLNNIHGDRADIFDFSAAAIRAAVTIPNGNQRESRNIESIYNVLLQSRNQYLTGDTIDWDEIESLFLNLLVAKGYPLPVAKAEILKAKNEVGLYQNEYNT